MSVTNKRILIVDDDPHIIEVLRFALEKAGFTLDTASNGRQALEKVKAHSFALIVLDITMPEMDGLEMCKQLRKFSDVPVLFLSSRDDEIDRIIGLEIGGDDYVTKPFSPRELVARVQVILKRTTTKPAETKASDVLHKGAVRVDAQRYVAYWHETPITLTATEFLLLYTLLTTPHKVFNRDELMDKVYEGVAVSDRTIDSHIRRIRQKFSAVGADNVIETMHGVGYRCGSCQ